MKTLRFYMIAALLLSAVPFMKAQNREESNNGEMVTLLGNSNHVGGYGALSLRYFGIDKRDGVMIGGRGGVVIGHSISFGITGTGFLTQPAYDPTLGEDAMIAGGYGGIYIEPIIMPNLPVHIALPITLGGGGIGYNINHNDNHHWDDDDDYIDGHGFLLVEPGVEVEFNVMKYFRFAVGASYKFTSNIELKYDNSSNTRIIASDALNGFTVGVTFKFGAF